jgi:sugar transferase (PEP-CTERM system associated)
MQLFNRQVSAKSATIFGIEALLIPSAIFVAAQVHGSFDRLASGVWQILLITVLCELCLYYNDMYDLAIVNTPRELLVRVLQAVGAVAIVLAAAYVTAPSIMFDAGTLATALVLFVVGVVAWRMAFASFATDAGLDQRVLIIGTGKTAHVLARQMALQQDFAYRLAGFLDDGQTAHQVRAHDVLGSIGDLERVLSEHRIDRIIVGLSDRRGRLPIEPLLRAKLAGVRVEDATTTYERLTGKILIDDLKPSSLIFSDGFRASRTTRAIKRMIDLALSIIASMVAAPLMALTAIAVQLDSPGPILYAQERVGENGRIFTLRKFRSMRADAERGTPVWARDRDDRVTRIGRILRVTRLDELPQLWNVLCGDMSFVGPRPERPYFVQQLAAVIPFYMERHVVKPGITGWAQVKYRYGSSIDDATEKLRYDLYYIKHLSIVFDLTIVFDTVKVVLFGKGAK